MACHTSVPFTMKCSDPDLSLSQHFILAPFQFSAAVFPHLGATIKDNRAILPNLFARTANQFSLNPIWQSRFEGYYA